MGDTTDDLLDLAEQVTPAPPARELDMLLTSGERISMALLAMAIAQLGAEARSFTGSQAGVITDEAHGAARIIDVTPGRIKSTLDAGHIAIVAGFQGVSQTTKDITTLGRGGSDTTAVAIAAALEADVCEIYTDVDGVFTADPRVLPSARKIDVISMEEMLDLAANGSKILHLRCVEYARRYGIPIHVRSSWSRKPGTWIKDNPYQGEGAVEAPIIAGIAHDRSEGKITIVGVPDRVGHRRPDLRRHRRGRHQHRHDRPERLRRRDGQDRHLLHPSRGRRPQGARPSCRASSTTSTSRTCASTTASARSPLSARG